MSAFARQVEAIRRAVAPIAEFARRAEAEWGGYSVITSERCTRGQSIINQGMRVLIIHPLDHIDWRTKGDPIARTEAIGDYFTKRAHAQLDLIISRLGSDRGA